MEYGSVHVIMQNTQEQADLQQMKVNAAIMMAFI